jgi:hypothetical protein
MMRSRMFGGVIVAALLVAMTAMFGGCTANEMARNYGGTMTVDLPEGTKLVTATWKGTHLWYLTRPMEEGERATTVTFKESSNMGMMEGTIIFREHEKK